MLNIFSVGICKIKKIKLGKTNFTSAHLYLQFVVVYVTNRFLSMKFIEQSSQMVITGQY